MPVFGVFVVRIFRHSDWTRRCEEIETRKTPNTSTFQAVMNVKCTFNLRLVFRLSYLNRSHHFFGKYLLHILALPSSNSDVRLQNFPHLIITLLTSGVHLKAINSILIIINDNDVFSKENRAYPHIQLWLFISLNKIKS